MKVSDFSYQLPDELIARFPAEERASSRLLVATGSDEGQLSLRHGSFPEIVELLGEGDLLLMNDTRVIPARMFGQKESGGRLEVLLERVLGENEALVHMRVSKMPKPGTRLLLEGEVDAEVLGRVNEFVHLRFTGGSALSLFEKFGRIPLPPYLEREASDVDRERYQTVYARRPGAAAAPTAGLHFDEDVLERLASAGVRTAFVTLHVGAGTFQSVRVEEVEEHRMHSEYIEVSEAVCQQVIETKARGNRVVCVGTTTLRSIETAAQQGSKEGKLIVPFYGETDIFIYPGYDFRVVDALVTNFHLPESTLLMLVSAFAGKDNILRAYKEAVIERYRFFSYGDAMYIEPGRQVGA